MSVCVSQMVYCLCQGAQKFLELKGLREGLFLVRVSNKNPSWHVLTICHDQKVFNYQIRTKVRPL